MDVNVLVAAALMLLAMVSILLIAAAYPLFIQGIRTLMAYEKLAQTLETELTPTMLEVNSVLQGINQLRGVATKRVAEVTHTVEDVTSTAANAAFDAKKQSSVWSTGLLAGLKAYLTETKDTKTTAFITNKGEAHVELHK